MAGIVENGDDVVNILAHQRFAAGQRDDDRAKPVELAADHADVVQTKFVGRIVLFFPEVADLALESCSDR